MSEGKYVEEVAKKFGALDNEMLMRLGPHDVLVAVANNVARQHPLQYERFRIRSIFVRGWRWATSGTWFGRSKRRDDSSERTDGGRG